jgi:hypothetical protein
VSNRRGSPALRLYPRAETVPSGDPKPKGAKPKKVVKPGPKAQINLTDPESRIMKSADKALIQGYNAQAAVDAESHIIVASDLTNQASDSPHLPAMIEQVLANTGRHPEELSADAGYFSEAAPSGSRSRTRSSNTCNWPTATGTR